MREFPVATPSERPRREVFSVSALNRRVKELLESGLPQVWVEGEISNLSRPGSGHVYFSLKDGQSQIRCALFRGRGQYVTAQIADGAQVLVRARLTMYEVRGDVQLVVQHMEDAGEGALRRAFEALKRKLQEEGLFDERRKQPLPTLPMRVGIVTSPTGAAIRDIIATFKRRFPAIPLLVYPVAVQGARAVEEICSALRAAERRRDCDVLILARGGGSLEDLQAFNDERVARAVSDCVLPLVCGVGHESDVTICDFVADRRAPTPTAAAEMISPDADQWLQGVLHTRRRLTAAIDSHLEQASQRVDWLGRLVVHPRQQLQARAGRLRSAFGALTSEMRSKLQGRRLTFMPLPARMLQCSPAIRMASLLHRVELQRGRLQQHMREEHGVLRQRLERAVSRLDSVNPLAVLARGYAMVTDPESHAIVKSVARVRLDDVVDVRVSDGSLRCAVRDKHADE